MVAIEVDLVLTAGEIGLAIFTAKVEDVVPLLYAEHAFVEMRRTEQLLQLILGHAGHDLPQILRADVRAFRQRGFGRIRECNVTLRLVSGGGMLGQRATPGSQQQPRAGDWQNQPWMCFEPLHDVP